MSQARIGIWRRFLAIDPRDIRHFVAYSKGVIRNIRSDSLQQRRHLSLDELKKNVGFEPVDSRAISPDDGIVLGSLLGHLSPLERQVIMLNADGFSYKEAAEEIGISVGRYQDILKFVRQKLQDQLYGDFPVVNQSKNTTYLDTRQIAKILKRPWLWIMPRLIRFKHLMVMRQTSPSRAEYLFPQAIVKSLEDELGECPPAGDWMTAREMANKLDKDWDWIMRRILQLRCHCELRRHYRYKTKVFYHYPPSALKELRTMRDEILSYPDSEGFFALSVLKAKLKRSGVWVRNRLRGLKVYAELRRGPTGRIDEYYPAEVLPQLEELAKKQKPARDWVSLNQISDSVGKDREWVEKNLAKLGITPEIRRIPGSGKEFPLYPPTVVGKLRKRAAKYKPPDRGWATKSQLESILGRNYKWISLRISEIPHQVRLRTDIHGVLREHFSPRLVKKLQTNVGDDRRGYRPRN